jgi:hypothetical protein
VIAAGETGPRMTQPADLERFEHRQANRLTCATADPNCCHLGCTSQAPWATKLPSPSQARVVGPAELTVRRRCPAGSRTTGVARLNEVRLALASLVRERDRDNKTKPGSGK